MTVKELKIEIEPYPDDMEVFICASTSHVEVPFIVKLCIGNRLTLKEKNRVNIDEVTF